MSIPSLSTATAALSAEHDSGNTVAALAQSLGATLLEDAYGLQAEFAPLGTEQIQTGFMSLLTDLGLIGVSGDDAAAFLHTQLTNDVEHLETSEGRWYGYCSPKGRMLGSFLGFKQPEGRIFLICSSTQLEPVRRRLSMFVLRAKAKLQDLSTEKVLIGIGGQQAGESLQGLGLNVPGPMQTAHAPGLDCVSLPAVTIAGKPCPRWLLVVDAAQAEVLWHSLSERLEPASSTTWRWTDVLSAIPRIVPSTAEQFVPQMLNFELVGGVNFKKGCYPGQEIVARSQYLGKLKRRMFLAHAEGGQPEPGSDVLPANGGEPCGQIVLAAPSPEGGVDLLFESQTAALQSGTPTASGIDLILRELPYPIPA